MSVNIYKETICRLEMSCLPTWLDMKYCTDISDHCRTVNVNRQMINLWQTITRGEYVSKAWKPSSSRLISIYFEFRSKPSLITVICMNPRSLAQQILICCDKILFSHTQRGYQFLFLDYFIIFRFLLLLLFYVIINFYKKYFIIFILLLLFFHENYFYFFMFRNVPECSMLLVLSTPNLRLHGLLQS